jgi:hypothetical protein
MAGLGWTQGRARKGRIENEDNQSIIFTYVEISQ